MLKGKTEAPTPTAEALEMAREAGLDLVEISPNNNPPICKILDFGKYKYQAQKKAAEQRKKQKIQDVKEIKMRPNIDTHDYEVKMRAVVKFLEEGDKVKVTLRFRGREMAHLELGMDLLKRVKEDIAEISKVDQEPKLEGRQMMMMVIAKVTAPAIQALSKTEQKPDHQSGFFCRRFKSAFFGDEICRCSLVQNGEKFPQSAVPRIGFNLQLGSNAHVRVPRCLSENIRPFADLAQLPEQPHQC